MYFTETLAFPDTQTLLNYPFGCWILHTIIMHMLNLRKDGSITVITVDVLGLCPTKSPPPIILLSPLVLLSSFVSLTLLMPCR